MMNVATTDESVLQRYVEQDEDYRHFGDLLQQASAHRTLPLEALEDDGSRSKAITSFQKNLPLENATFRRHAYNWTLNELAELAFFDLRSAPIYEAISLSVEYVEYYRTKWRGYLDFHPALQQLKEVVGMRTDMRQLAEYYPAYHLWEMLARYYTLKNPPVASQELLAGLLPPRAREWVDPRAVDFILEKAMRLWDIETAVSLVASRGREGEKLPVFLMSLYVEEYPAFRDAPISWWLTMRGWEK